MHANSSPNRADLNARSATERIVGLDIIRFISFYAIVFFHWGASLWAPLGYRSMPVPGIQWAEIYGRLISFSGFSVLLLSFFLFGYRGQGLRKQNVLLPLMLIFAVLWALNDNQFPYIWDIYWYLLVSTSAVVLLDALKLNPWPIAISGLVFTSLPFWKLEGWIHLAPWLEQIMWGVCRNGASLGEWPILPWLGFPVFAWGLGRIASAHKRRLATTTTGEAIAWALALGLGATQFGKYYVTPLGDSFGCFIFRQNAWTFWGHQVWVLFFMRMSFLKSVGDRLADSRVAQWISRRQVNQRFFFVYFIHYPLALWLASEIVHLQLGFDALAVNLGLLMIILLTEGAGVVFGLVARHNWLNWEVK